MTKDAIIFSTTTAYGSYEVVDTVYNGRPARVLYSGNRLSAQSGIPKDGRAPLLFDYNQRFMELLEGIKPKRTLLIGGGALTLPAALLAQLPDIQLDVVELDPQLLQIGKRYFGFEQQPSVTLYSMDGLAFLRTNTTHYDMILIDVFQGVTIPASFQTQEAAQLLRRALHPAGIVAMNIIASFHGERSHTLHRQASAFGSVFPTVHVYPAGHEPSLWLPQNFIMTAQEGKQDLQPYMRFPAVELPEI